MTNKKVTKEKNIYSRRVNTAMEIGVAVFREDGLKAGAKTVLKNVSISTLITIVNYELYQTSGTENETKEKPKAKPKKVLEQECKEEDMTYTRPC